RFAEAIRNAPGRRERIATMAVGAITEPAQVNTLLHTRRADLVALARPHLWNPTFANQAAAWYGARTGTWPPQYLSGRDQAFRELQKARADRLELQKKARPARHLEPRNLK
ncbi:MAG TPA: bifunctional salicylyl-CoA 5-hydroxylase/oxidoreductase, partial [Thermoanaerobaculia bacterium]|nr:bifunctional salicylyl-CoA 5-hydroxylase/oxidoreductase [Thermoanaerobaculia bacterium]